MSLNLSLHSLSSYTHKDNNVSVVSDQIISIMYINNSGNYHFTEIWVLKKDFPIQSIFIYFCYCIFRMTLFSSVLLKMTDLFF